MNLFLIILAILSSFQVIHGASQLNPSDPNYPMQKCLTDCEHELKGTGLRMKCPIHCEYFVITCEEPEIYEFYEGCKKR